jgi:hypothetical protein
MIRLLTAAAMVALLSSPVMAQSVSPSDPGTSSSSTWERGSGPADSQSGSQGMSGESQELSNEQPIDCGPQDPRPECQTAQLPTEEGAQDPSAQQEPDLRGIGDAPAEMPGDDSRYGNPEQESGSGSGSMNR